LLQIFALLLQIFALLQNFALLFGINCTEINQSQSINIFMYIIKIGNSMVSSAIWKKHARVSFSKTIKIARVRRTCAISSLWKTHEFMFLKLHEKPYDYLLIIYNTCDSRLISADPPWSGGETVCDQSTLMMYSCPRTTWDGIWLVEIFLCDHAEYCINYIVMYNNS
jgi:hypothetical protein